jgi:hypothetical protein
MALNTAVVTSSAGSSVCTDNTFSGLFVSTSQASMLSKAFKNGVTDLMQLPQLMFVLNCKVVMLFSF